MDIHDINNFKVLSEIINSGDVLVDVGSNIGDYTNFFKEILKESGKIYSIELSPDSYEILKEQNKNSGNVIVLNYAISDKNEIIPYFKGKHHCLHNILGYDVINNLSDKSGEIESIRLDTLLKNELNIKLIKIDVEGAELMVLNGLTNILNCVQYILVECHFEKDWEEIKNLLLNEYKFDCKNISADKKEETISEKSNLAYQCFCKKKII